MRTLQLSHEQIDLLLNALNQAERNMSNAIKENTVLLNQESKSAIINQIAKINDLSFSINNSELDV